MTRSPRLTDKQLEAVSLFLKLLYETTKNTAKVMSVPVEAKGLNVPYYTNIGVILRNKGIIQLTPDGKHKHFVKWVSTTEPDDYMRDAIINELRRYGTESHAKARAMRKQILDEANNQPIAPTLAIEETITPTDDLLIILLKSAEITISAEDLLGIEKDFDTYYTLG